MSVPPKGSFGTARFAAYRDALNAISARTRTPLPSLVLSFAILHELTAIVPVVGFFFAARGLGVGERVVGAVTASGGERDEDSWVKGKGREWVDEGSQWVEKVGSRYGVFGFEKRTKETAAPRGDISSRIAGDAANAIVAYGLTKALLPVRIGFSLYMSPAFSRRVIEPIRLVLIRPFQKRLRRR